MDVTRVVVGPLATNCYVVAAGGKVVVVDPGAQPKKILKAVAGMKVAAILLTHGHPDHVGALDALLPFVAAPFFAPAGDVPLLVKYTSLDVSRLLKDGDRVAFNGASLRAVATPGHTPGSTCYYAPGILFAGDTLFAGGVGRTAGDDAHRTLLGSIRDKIFTLPDETVVYPGHGEPTTVDEEKKHNPFFEGR